jgi:hypothetical protein
VLDALLVVLHHSVAEGGLVDDLAEVLEDEVIGLQVSICPQAESLLLGLDDRDVGVLLALEPLVLAALPAVAIAIDTLDFGRPVDAVRVFTAGVVLAVACRGRKISVLGAAMSPCGRRGRKGRKGRKGRRESNLRHSSAQSQSNASWSEDPMFLEP